MAYNATPLMICYSIENLLLKIGWLAGVSVMQFWDSEHVEMNSHYGADCGLYILWSDTWSEVHKSKHK
jgi:hypothetical protein